METITIYFSNLSEQAPTRADVDWRVLYEERSGG